MLNGEMESREIRRLIWTPHAQQRLVERPDVPREMVEDTLRHPEQRFADPTHADTTIAQRRYLIGSPAAVLMRVFYVDHGEGTTEVISFYRTSRIQRYWRPQTTP